MPSLQSALQSIRKLALAASLLAIAACGGGESAAVTTVPTAAAATIIEVATTVQSSDRDLLKLANTQWESDCGYGDPIETGLLYVISGFEFGTPIGTTLPGTVTMGRYTDTGCRSQNPAQQRLMAVSISYIQELAVRSDTPLGVQGTADQLLITTLSTGATQTFAIGFLPGYTRFLGGRDGRVNGSSVGYTKY